MDERNLIGKINSLSKGFTLLSKEILPLLNQSNKSASKGQNMTDAILQALHSFGLDVRPPRQHGIMVELQGSRDISAVTLLLESGPLSAKDTQTVSFGSHKARAKLGSEETLIGLGVVWVLNQIRQDIPGRIRVFFRPRHEITPGVPVDGRYEEVVDNTRAIFGLYLDPSVPLGCAGINLGAILASNDSFTLTINGKSSRAHHSLPIVNKIQVAAQVVTALRQLASRKVDPLRPVSLAIKSIHGDENDSQAPVAVELQGTIRTVDHEIQRQIPFLMENTIEGITKAYGCNYHLQITKGSPIVTNDEEVTLNLKKAAEEILGKDSVIDMKCPRMVAEDYAQFLKHVPGSFIHFGTGDAEIPCLNLPQTNSHLNDCIEVGVKTLSWALVKFLRENPAKVQS